jgi:hypothetical protein
LEQEDNLFAALDRLERERLDLEVFRTARLGHDPLWPSTYGGRWMAPGTAPVLYTSLTRECATVEFAYRWSRNIPLLRIPSVLHRIRVTARKTLRLNLQQLVSLGVDLAVYRSNSYGRTQQIGAVVNQLECDGLIVPSARIDGENLVLFTKRLSLDDELELLSSEYFDWIQIALENSFLDANDPGVQAVLNAVRG